jgi:predicted small secreted protein
MQRSLLLSSFLVVCTTYFVLSAANTMLGGAKEAKIDSHTEDVAKFAVTQLNAKANFPVQGTLKLGRIVSAKTQVVAGINHILHLETSDDAGAKQVEVTVYEKLPANLKANEAPMELTNSKLVGPVAE